MITILRSTLQHPWCGLALDPARVTPMRLKVAEVEAFTDDVIMAEVTGVYDTNVLASLEIDHAKIFPIARIIVPERVARDGGLRTKVLREFDEVIAYCGTALALTDVRLRAWRPPNAEESLLNVAIGVRP